VVRRGVEELVLVEMHEPLDAGRMTLPEGSIGIGVLPPHEIGVPVGFARLIAGQGLNGRMYGKVRGGEVAMIVEPEDDLAEKIQVIRAPILEVRPEIGDGRRERYSVGGHAHARLIIPDVSLRPARGPGPFAAVKPHAMHLTAKSHGVRL
jgi:hypothetical protein